jgi:hypothetical protein
LPEANEYPPTVEAALLPKYQRMMPVRPELRHVAFTGKRPKAPVGKCPPAEQRFYDVRKLHGFFPGHVYAKQWFRDEKTNRRFCRRSRATMTRMTPVEPAPEEGREQVLGWSIGMR